MCSDAEDCWDALRRFDRHSAFLNHEFVERTIRSLRQAHSGERQRVSAGGRAGVHNAAGGELEELEVRGTAATNSMSLCGRVHTDEDQLGGTNRSVYVGWEEEISSANLLHSLIKTGLQSSIWIIRI